MKLIFIKIIIFLVVPVYIVSAFARAELVKTRSGRYVVQETKEPILITTKTIKSTGKNQNLPAVYVRGCSLILITSDVYDGDVAIGDTVQFSMGAARCSIENFKIIKTKTKEKQNKR